MANVKGITVELGMNTDKVQQKLRAIAKHVGALADELDAIDNAWSCSNCGHGTKVTYYQDNTIECSQCESCGKLSGDELPTGG